MSLNSRRHYMPSSNITPSKTVLRSSPRRALKSPLLPMPTVQECHSIASATCRMCDTNSPRKVLKSSTWGSQILTVQAVGHLPANVANRPRGRVRLSGVFSTIWQCEPLRNQGCTCPSFHVGSGSYSVMAGATHKRYSHAQNLCAKGEPRSVVCWYCA